LVKNINLFILVHIQNNYMKVIKEYNITRSLEDYFRDENISLEEQNKLTFLNCYHNQLTSLEGIENCINLERLSCWNNQLTSLKGIENLTNLKRLYCSYNQLTSLKGIEKCTKLTYLWCNHNQLTSLKELKKLTKLDYLWCDDIIDIDQYKDKIKDMNINL
jgi:internalin A